MFRIPYTDLKIFFFKVGFPFSNTMIVERIFSFHLNNGLSAAVVLIHSL